MVVLKIKAFIFSHLFSYIIEIFFLKTVDFDNVAVTSAQNRTFFFSCFWYRLDKIVYNSPSQKKKINNILLTLMMTMITFVKLMRLVSFLFFKKRKKNQVLKKFLCFIYLFIVFIAMQKKKKKKQSPEACSSIATNPLEHISENFNYP